MIFFPGGCEGWLLEVVIIFGVGALPGFTPDAFFFSSIFFTSVAAADLPPVLVVITRGMDTNLLRGLYGGSREAYEGMPTNQSAD
jgi:hypothetical protein